MSLSDRDNAYAPMARPHPEVRPPGEPPPPLRAAAFRAPPEGARRRRRRPGLVRRMPLIGALACAAAGFAAIAVVFTRAPPEPEIPPPHHPTRLAPTPVPGIAPASGRPKLRGAVHAAIENPGRGARHRSAPPRSASGAPAPPPVASAAPPAEAGRAAAHAAAGRRPGRPDRHAAALRLRRHPSAERACQRRADRQAPDRSS
jgi:hypothetical protein